MTAAIATQYDPHREPPEMGRTFVVDASEWAPHPRPRTLSEACVSDSFVFHADITPTASARRP